MIRRCLQHARAAIVVFIAFMVSGLIFGSPGIALSVAPQLNQTGFDVPSAGTVIVVLKDNTFTASSEDVAVEIGVPILLQYDSALNGFATNANQTQINKLAANPNVAYIAASIPIVAAVQTPSTAIPRTAISGFSQIDGVDNVANIGIAILDTGVQAGHPDLRYAGGLDCTGSGTDQPVAGGTGDHGTHVAGIAGAIDNGDGVVGSAPGARIYNYKVLQSVSVGQSPWLICGINAAINNNDVSVINMSLAGLNPNASTCSAPDPVHQAVCSARNAGKLMVAAAGNNNADAGNYMPAKYPEVVTVGNIRDVDGAPGGDSYNSTSNYGTVVDIAAPGTSIRSTIPTNAYGTMTGTSMAAPLVAGAAAQFMATGGGGAAAATSWLLNTASVPMNTANGCACSPPAQAGGSPNRMLYLGGITSGNPPGTMNPSFSGTKIPILGSSDSPATGRSGYVHDGNSASKWYSDPNTPTSARFTVDLGSDKEIKGIKWKFDYIGYADEFTVRIIHSSGVSRTYGPFGNATQANTFFGQFENSYTVIRYVEFNFQNPRSLPSIGSVSEVEVWGVNTPVYPPGSQNPVFGGTKLPITGSSDTPATGRSVYLFDNNNGTKWYTTPPTGSSVRFALDLGANKEIKGIKWKFDYTGYADEFSVRIIHSSGVSRTYGPFGNATAANTFFGQFENNYTVIRYVEFIVQNPRNLPSIGSFSEVEIWGVNAIVGASVNPPGEENPTFEGSKLPIAGVSDTPATTRPGYTIDNNPGSKWYTDPTTPETAQLRFDLGADTEISGIKWKFDYIGYANEFTVRIVNEQGGSRTYGPFGDATEANTFFGQVESNYTVIRYVEFNFANPQNLESIGSVSEVEIWGGLPKGTSDPQLAGSPQPLTCTADPTNDSVRNACDENGGTNWHTDPDSPETATLTATLDQPMDLTGIKWVFAQQGNAESFNVSVGNGDVITSVGDYSGGEANLYEGITFAEVVTADRVIVTFINVDADTELAYLAELEVWSEQQPAATPGATPDASPAASPAAGIPEPIETETPAGTPDAGTPAPVETEIPAGTPDAGTPEPVETEIPTATVEPTTTDAASPAPATEEPTETPEPTATSEPTVEPTAAISVGTITGTGGDAVNCRISAPDGEPITQLSEGDAVAVTGPAVDGWLPVICDGQAGFIAEDFVSLGDVTPTESAEATATTEGGASPTETATEQATTEPTATEEPEETPYSIADTGDTENSGTAWFASDDDASTSWSLYPGQSPEQARLYVDLGSVLPIDRITIELATWDQLPVFEIWLSEDGETWYNATPDGINGWNLERDVPLEIGLGYDARYIRIVIPNVDEQLGEGVEVGGIRQIDVWAGDISETQYLTSLGEPTTPTPEPVQPTEEVIPTEIPTEEDVIEEPTEEPTVGDVPTEEITEPTVEDEAPTEEAVG